RAGGSWCRRGDSNPHGLPHTPLKRARLPVPPLRRRAYLAAPPRALSRTRSGSDLVFRTIRRAASRVARDLSRRRRLTPQLALAEPGVEGFAQALAEEIEGEDE